MFRKILCVSFALSSVAMADDKVKLVHCHDKDNGAEVQSFIIDKTKMKAFRVDPNTELFSQPYPWYVLELKRYEGDNDFEFTNSDGYSLSSSQAEGIKFTYFKWTGGYFFGGETKKKTIKDVCS